MKWLSHVLKLVGFAPGSRTIIMTVITAVLALVLKEYDGVWDSTMINVLEYAFVACLASVPVFLRKGITSLRN